MYMAPYPSLIFPMPHICFYYEVSNHPFPGPKSFGDALMETEHERYLRKKSQRQHHIHQPQMESPASPTPPPFSSSASSISPVPAPPQHHQQPPPQSQAALLKSNINLGCCSSVKYHDDLSKAVAHMFYDWLCESHATIKNKY